MRAGRGLLYSLAILGLVASACRSGGDSGGAPAAPVRGGTLIIGTAGINLRNAGTVAGGSATESTMLIYQGLLSVGADLDPQPELAESFEPQDDGAVWRFTLRKVMWHDGRPFTSADVKFTFEKILLEFHPRTRQVLKPKLSSIETPDDQTVIFRLKQPFSAFPLLMTVGDAPILPKHIFDGTDPKTNPANEAPIGTGPFKFVSYKKDEELRLTRNTDYFREGLPYLNEVVYRAIPERSTTAQALERGDVDLVIDPAAADLERLRNDPTLRVAVNSVGPGSANCSEFFAFNLDKPLFADAGVRRAIAHGIDRQRFVDDLLFGNGKAQSSPIHSGIEWAQAEVGYPEYDAKEADEILTGAGWVEGADGKRIAKGIATVADGAPLRFGLALDDSQAKYGEIIREQLGAIGIEVNLVPEDKDLSETRVFEKRDFDTYQSTACQGLDPELGLRRTIHSEAVIPVVRTNGAGFRNSEIDSLLDEAAAELDQKTRAGLYRQIQQILTREMPYVWLVEELQPFAHKRSCVGFRFDSAALADRAYCRD